MQTSAPTPEIKTQFIQTPTDAMAASLSAISERNSRVPRFGFNTYLHDMFTDIATGQLGDERMPPRHPDIWDMLVAQENGFLIHQCQIPTHKT